MHIHPNVEQIYTGCLAQGAYFIHSNGEAVVIDPLRESAPYLERAEKLGVKIKYVLETHFHADFVSGHVALAEKTGAQIVYGPNANPDFPFHSATDGEILTVGDLKIKVLHTPGHTMESTCYLLIDEQGMDRALFSGDTLFLGDVGRPDLAQKAASMTQEDLASILFDSLRSKLMTLSPEIVIYPGHGAGSACGKNMSKETVGTLGEQLQTNYALRESMTREEFVAEVTDGLLPPPAYFPENVALNKKAIPGFEEILAESGKAFDPIAFEAMANEMEALVLDTRKPQSFAAGHIPNSINIGIDGGFAPWVGALIPDIKQNILLVTDLGREEEVIKRMARVGYDHVLGYLEGGFDAWTGSGKESDSVESIPTSEFAQRLAADPAAVVIDVRKIGEYTAERMTTSINLPLDDLNERFNELPSGHPVYIHCAGGYRSMIFSSILKSRGVHNIVDIQGGFGAIKNQEGIEVTNYVCPSSGVAMSPPAAETASATAESSDMPFLKRLLNRLTR
jgi:glyoxylase-like metal-dependent hydrolase (beta-lactamase superfamily II)/rhodanese-related sulfurtransferase